jgi:hypothetical protein
MATQTAVKVDPIIHSLIAHGATALDMTQKDLLAEAVREYLAARREEINAQLRKTMQILDGSTESQSLRS